MKQKRFESIFRSVYAIRFKYDILKILMIWKNKLFVFLMKKSITDVKHWSKNSDSQWSSFFKNFRKKNIFLKMLKINEISSHLSFRLCDMRKQSISAICIINSFEHIMQSHQKFDETSIFQKKQFQLFRFWNSWKTSVTFDIKYIVVNSTSITKNTMIIKIINHFSSFISNARNIKFMINHSRNLFKISKTKKKRIRRISRQTQTKKKKLRKLRRHEKIVFLWKNTTSKKKTTQNIKIEKNRNINSIKTNDTLSKITEIVKVDIKKKIDIRIIDKTIFRIIFDIKIDHESRKHIRIITNMNHFMTSNRMKKSTQMKNMTKMIQIFSIYII